VFAIPMDMVKGEILGLSAFAGASNAAKMVQTRKRKEKT